MSNWSKFGFFVWIRSLKFWHLFSSEIKIKQHTTKNLKPPNVRHNRNTQYGEKSLIFSDILLDTVIYTMGTWNLITGKKPQTSGFPVSNSQPPLSLELMEKSQIAGESPQGNQNTSRSTRGLQLCHTKYHITFLSPYFSKVRDPFPPQTVSKISHHKIKYMLKPCKDIFD